MTNKINPTLPQPHASDSQHLPLLSLSLPISVTSPLITTPSMETSSIHQQNPSPPPPKPITRSESVNPYPTTFVQADSSSFKQVVQMLTGSPQTAKQASAKPVSGGSNADSVSKTHIPPIKSLPKRQQSGFKLYERRNSLNKLKINPLIPGFGSSCNSGFSPRNPEILSPSILDFPALALSPVTPLIPDPFDRSGLANAKSEAEAEDKAIKEKGFYLHPSPTTTPRESEPRLLPLFPLTSPRVPG
ncbi:VQ motif-containing protein 4-like isoform X3 [Cucurbita pepo subsp. pepo]|uniref:VQ motif-containing protein 4-like isoform X2 n=1 Tax=Cucurbita pepo subsp. pepo TaxID=3664 RepID=UPI000C9D69EA|nr:VQ motif-containing protein 4-like isoform X2 [Cucurbita pepo subsp. pepo]XP_023542745.1 VQ motif-containing protein 4-like isoform X3 [Cucurbita pepo subsp. pepo]